MLLSLVHRPQETTQLHDLGRLSLSAQSKRVSDSDRGPDKDGWTASPPVPSLRPRGDSSEQASQPLKLLVREHPPERQRSGHLVG